MARSPLSAGWITACSGMRRIILHFLVRFPAWVVCCCLGSPICRSAGNGTWKAEAAGGIGWRLEVEVIEVIEVIESVEFRAFWAFVVEKEE